MFLINADEDYPIGMVFDQGVFTAIAKWDPQFLRKEFEEIDFNDPVVFNKILGIYKDINRYIEVDLKMVERMEKYLTLTDKSPDELLIEAYASVMGEASIEKLKINYNVDKIKKHLPLIQSEIKKTIINTKLRPTFAPIHEMAKGMKDSFFNYTVSFRKLQRMNPVDISRRLQGTVTKKEILNKLQFLGTPDTIQNWIKKWIEESDDKKLQLFLFAVSGSNALGKEAMIAIGKGDWIMFHTCFNKLDLDYKIESEKDFVKRLEDALEYVKANPSFNVA